MSAPTKDKLRLAYLTTCYPTVSHTFIRREIAGLEERGHSVLRLSIRPAGDVVDPADRAEADRTFHCLAQPKLGLVARAAWVLATRFPAALRALHMTSSMSRASERGLLRHLAYLAEAAVLLERLRRERIEHVHVHFGTNAAAVARLIRCLGGPSYSMTIHGPDEFDAAIGLSLDAKMIDAAFTVAITDFCASQLRRWIPYTQWDKLHVVHCTVGDQYFGQAEPVSEGADTLVSVGRFSAQKGQILLLDAFAGLRAQGVDARLVLVGDGELRGVLEKRIAALGLGDRVTLTGWQDERQVREHLRASRGFVLASFAEGLPVVLMEALALGRPVVATAIAGIPELVRSGKEGWLVAAGNVPALRDAMAALCTTPAEELTAMGQSGAARVREEHSTATEVAKLEALFRRYPGREDAP